MRNLFPLLLAGCSAALANNTTETPAAPEPDVAALRARGPAALDELLARYDQASTPELADEIDAVAGQRYATVSRLYWYTDLAAAERAAHTRHAPILSLRILGDLRDDLSCANSRLFRATLYANAQVSAFLRDHFVLYWSSERPVPQVTIDLGDGKHRLARTTTGNSAHFVLDEDGHVLDVLPGLYEPTTFRKQLANSLALADSVRGKTDDQRRALVTSYQQTAVTSARDQWTHVLGMWVVPGLQRLTRASDVDGALALAQRAAMSKAVVEVPDLQQIGAGRKILDDGDVAAWATVGQIVFGIGDLTKLDRDQWGRHLVVETHAGSAPAASAPLPPLFDARSLALIGKIASTPSRPLSPQQITAMVARLEQTTVADTAQDQLKLRPLISQHIIDGGGSIGFAELDAWVYAQVFHTPADDAWMGLVSDTAFSGLPGDGVVPTVDTSVARR